MAEIEQKINNQLLNQLAKTKDVDYCKSQGNSWYEAGVYETALIHYTASIQISPKEREALNRRGMTLYQLKRYEESLLDYTAAIDLEPEFIFYYNRGLSLLALSQYLEALIDFTRAFLLNPWDIDILKMIIKLRLEADIGAEVPYF